MEYFRFLHETFTIFFTNILPSFPSIPNISILQNFFHKNSPFIFQSQNIPLLSATRISAPRISDDIAVSISRARYEDLFGLHSATQYNDESLSANGCSLRNYLDKIAVDPALGSASGGDDLFYHNDSLIFANSRD